MSPPPMLLAWVGRPPGDAREEAQLPLPHHLQLGVPCLKLHTAAGVVGASAEPQIAPATLHIVCEGLRARL
jgi:hypothetical protein